MEALGPVLASIGSVVMMGEVLSGRAWSGAALVTVAVMLVAGSSESDNRGFRWSVAGAHRCDLWFDGSVPGTAGVDQQRPLTDPDGSDPSVGGWLALLPVLLRSGGNSWPMGGSARLRILVATALGTNLGIALQQLVFQQMAVGPGVTPMSTAPVMALCIGHWEGSDSGPWSGGGRVGGGRGGLHQSLKGTADRFGSIRLQGQHHQIDAAAGIRRPGGRG